MNKGFRGLTVYQKSFSLAMEIFEIYNDLIDKSEEVGRLLNHMIENPEKYKPRN